MNKIFHGAAMATMFMASSMGHAAHIVSSPNFYNGTVANLEGPVFGKCIGTYWVQDENHPPVKLVSPASGEVLVSQ